MEWLRNFILSQIVQWIFRLIGGVIFGYVAMVLDGQPIYIFLSALAGVLIFLGLGILLQEIVKQAKEPFIPSSEPGVERSSTITDKDKVIHEVGIAGATTSWVHNGWIKFQQFIPHKSRKDSRK